ncbi:hypothetical protein NFI96_018872 [Prochilodus magdalenae]|nr:hypothetical protein NFI96_018872 [Prochilodus magdalenae]
MIRGLLLTFLSILSARVLQPRVGGSPVLVAAPCWWQPRVGGSPVLVAAQCWWKYTMTPTEEILRNLRGGAADVHQPGEAVGVDDPPNTPPAPELTQVQVRGTAVLLQCQAPQGHGGHLFKLYRVRERMSTVRWEAQQPQAVFEVQVSAVEDDHYCCQYDNSAISRYLTVKAAPRGLKVFQDLLSFSSESWCLSCACVCVFVRVRLGFGLATSRAQVRRCVVVRHSGSIMPTAPPQLSVTPPASQVLPGKVLDFYCQAPPPSPGQPPLTFLLIRRPWGAESDQEVGRSSDPHFKVGPVRHLEEGNYTCMYQFTLPDGVRNSNPTPLPAPQLSRDDEGVLVCTGSPSYPGAHFSLFHQGTESPAATQHAPKVQYSARFTVSAQPGQVEGVYQCQYSVQLGSNWAHSERSTAIKLSCTAGSPSCSHFPSGYTPPPTAAGKMDLALIIGSVSAALLFLLVLIILGVALHKHGSFTFTLSLFWVLSGSPDASVTLFLSSVPQLKHRQRRGGRDRHSRVAVRFPPRTVPGGYSRMVIQWTDVPRQVSVSQTLPDMSDSNSFLHLADQPASQVQSTPRPSERCPLRYTHTNPSMRVLTLYDSVIYKHGDEQLGHVVVPVYREAAMMSAERRVPRAVLCVRPAVEEAATSGPAYPETVALRRRVGGDALLCLQSPDFNVLFYGVRDESVTSPSKLT